ncbi:MAG: hypothetical protein QXT44_02595 [Candidatus Bathyarchaeia archaeon]
MLLPSLIELKKPKDLGPRVIKDYDYMILHDLDLGIEIADGGNLDLEKELNANITVPKEVSSILAFLSDLES